MQLQRERLVRRAGVRAGGLGMNTSPPAPSTTPCHAPDLPSHSTITILPPCPPSRPPRRSSTPTLFPTHVPPHTPPHIPPPHIPPHIPPPYPTPPYPRVVNRGASGPVVPREPPGLYTGQLEHARVRSTSKCVGRWERGRVSSFVARLIAPAGVRNHQRARTQTRRPVTLGRWDQPVWRLL